MNGNVYFDHIEVHVRDIPAYGQFLTTLFKGGRFKQISDSGTSMFITPDGVNIEVKAAQSGDRAVAGFRLPCIRLEGARAHIEEELGLAIDRTITNPEGEVHFFHDPEGIEWHAKDYAHRDRYINW